MQQGFGVQSIREGDPRDGNLWVLAIPFSPCGAHTHTETRRRRGRDAAPRQCLVLSLLRHGSFEMLACKTCLLPYGKCFYIFTHLHLVRASV